MLLQFRKLTRGAIATIIIGLVGLAMVAFLVPETGFQMVGSGNLARIGDREVKPPQLTRELSLTLRAERDQGNTLTQQEAIDEGIHLRLLDRMIMRLALYNFSDRLGISASDADVAQTIRDIPAVTNPVTGAFDETAYARFLNELGYSRTEFENDIRGDITINMMMQALVTGVRAPSSYGALAVAYQAETRTVSIAEAPASAVGTIPPPTEPQLQAFWEENQERLRIPEFRALTLVFADPADFIARVDVPEPRLREEFDARRAALTRPERRTYVRIAAQTEQQATDVAARLNRGESAATVASAAGLQVTRGENQARTEVADARVAEAIFSLSRGQARAVRGELSPWAVVRVESITEAQAPDFAQMRDELRLAIARDEAADLLNESIGAFEDARAAGTPISEAASAHGLRVVTVAAVEEGGRDRTGEPVAALEGADELLRTAFRTPEGEASDFTPVGDADVIVAVDRVFPSTVRPLEEVRADLTQLWLRRERTRRMRELGEEVMEAVREGQSFGAAARARGFNVVVSSQAINRQAASQIPARALAGQIFAAREGELASDLRADGGAMLVAVVEAIHRVDPAEQPQAVEAARQQMEQGLTQSFGEALQNEVVARARVQRNERLINEVYQRSTGDEEGE